jgi:hypothetical protein
LPSLPPGAASIQMRGTPFPDPEVGNTAFPTPLAARLAISVQLSKPLGSLPDADRAFIDAHAAGRDARSENCRRTRARVFQESRERLMRASLGQPAYWRLEHGQNRWFAGPERRRPRCAAGADRCAEIRNRRCAGRDGQTHADITCHRRHSYSRCARGAERRDLPSRRKLRARGAINESTARQVPSRCLAFWCMGGAVISPRVLNPALGEQARRKTTWVVKPTDL